ncbi:ATP-binding protein [Bacillus testis]|uniref:ATP-binding protein n=1 Tax=Bacillus testis TaxID=1622072 RepID=UPI00067F4AFA|nr:ATP-binding protein [Bacillus testis]
MINSARNSKRNRGFVELIGLDKAKDHLFKIRPDLIDKTREVSIERCKCGKCGEDTMFCWVYYLKDEDEPREELCDQYCSRCRDKIFSREITLEMSQKRRENIRANWYLPHPTHISAGFKNFNAYNDCTRKSLQVAKDYTKKILAGEKISLLCMGSTGTGKSHLATAIARTLDEKGMVVGFISAAELFNKIKESFNTPGIEKRLFEDMRALDVLVIDDVGVETVKTTNEISWSVSKWTEIIDNRLNLANIWTTNFDDIKIRDVIGERAVSRMYTNSMFIDMFCEDYRKTKQIII